MLRGDPGRLRQVLLNLVGNAVKFTEHGEVIVRVGLADLPRRRSAGTARQTTTDGDSAVQVIDTGIGIPEDMRTKLFVSRSPRPTARRRGGTVARAWAWQSRRRLVELMGGSIGVESTPGQGSTFWFTARFVVARQSRRRPRGRSPSLAGLRMLVVDDNATSRTHPACPLTAWGMTRLRPTAARRRCAMLRGVATRRRTLRRWPMLDMQMPGMDGPGAGPRRSRPTRAARHLPIVMLTSLGLSDDEHGDPRRRASRASLTKPVRQLAALQAARSGDGRADGAGAADELTAAAPARDRRPGHLRPRRRRCRPAAVRAATDA